MSPLTAFNNNQIKVLFTDIDDTLTKEGLLQKEAFSAIWTLAQRGINVVPVTGRPAGWCELIARQWPVTGVIGENGGLYFHYAQKKMQRYFVCSEKVQKSNRKKLEKIAREVLEKVPGTAIASDQFCRVMDLAIDFCEDVIPLEEKEVDHIVSIFKKHGAEAKVSSIHVNGWFGDYDKLSMCKIFCEKVLGFSLEQNLDIAAFVGDSPNDEPMFGFFSESFGVANLKKFLNRLQVQPRYLSSKPYGEGFAEVTERILALQ